MSRWAAWLAVAVVTFGAATASAQDLISNITDIAIDYANNRTRFTIQVCNYGSVQAPASQLGLYYDAVTGPGCNDTPDRTRDIAALPAGQCAPELDIVRQNTPLGGYTAWTAADWDCAVDESDETNNLSSRSYALLPNLRVLFQQVAVVGDTVTFKGRIWNAGASLKAPFKLGLYWDSPAAPGCSATPNGEQLINGIGYGEQVGFGFTRPGTPDGVYLAWAFADYECVIEESNESVNKVSRPYSVGRNIRVFAPSATVNGSTVTYRVWVCNDGSKETGPFAVDLWYDRAQAPPCDQAGADWRWKVANLKPSPLWSERCMQLTHVRGGAEGGSYVAWVFADPGCEVAETVENDNRGSAPYAVPFPDLTVAAFNATVNTDDVLYQVMVCNDGASTTRPFEIGLYFDESSAPGCATATDHTWAVIGLTAGGCITRQHTRSGVPTGNYTGWAMVDHQCNVSESSETNNTRQTSYAIAPTQPDLLVDSFVVTPIDSSTVSYAATVCNAGLATSGAFEIGLYFTGAAPACDDPADHAVLQSASLAQGGCVDISHTDSGAAPGGYTAHLFVDRTCEIDEFNEANNVDSAAYEVPQLLQPDLLVSQLQAEVVGTTVTFKTKICNSGQAASGPSKVGLFYDLKGSTPSCQTGPNDTADVPALQPATCVDRQWTRSNTALGSYTGQAMADVECAVAEEDEDNNSIATPYTVTHLDGGVQDVGPPPDGGVDGAADANADASAEDGAQLDGASDTTPVVDFIAEGDPIADLASPDAGGDGPPPAVDDGGCCSVGRGSRTQALWALAALLLLGVLRRRRRR